MLAASVVAVFNMVATDNCHVSEVVNVSIYSHSYDMAIKGAVISNIKLEKLGARLDIKISSYTASIEIPITKIERLTSVSSL